MLSLETKPCTKARQWERVDSRKEPEQSSLHIDFEAENAKENSGERKGWGGDRGRIITQGPACHIKEFGFYPKDNGKPLKVYSTDVTLSGVHFRKSVLNNISAQVPLSMAVFIAQDAPSVLRCLWDIWALKSSSLFEINISPFLLLTIGFHLSDVVEKAKLSGQKPNQWLPGAGSGQRGWLQKGIREYFVMMEIWFHDCMCLPNLVELYTKKGDVTACKLCLNNRNFKKDKDILPSYWLLHIHCTLLFSVVPLSTLTFVTSNYLCPFKSVTWQREVFPCLSVGVSVTMI